MVPYANPRVFGNRGLLVSDRMRLPRGDVISSLEIQLLPSMQVWMQSSAD